MLRFVVAVGLAAVALGQPEESVSTRELAPPEGMSAATEPAAVSAEEPEEPEVAAQAPSSEAEDASAGERTETADATGAGQQKKEQVARPTSESGGRSGRPIAAFWFVSTSRE